MRKPFPLILATILLSCSGESEKPPTEKIDTDSGCDKLVDSLKHAIATRNDSIVKLTHIIDEQADSILKFNGGVKSDDYYENSIPKDSLPKK